MMGFEESQKMRIHSRFLDAGSTQRRSNFVSWNTNSKEDVCSLFLRTWYVRIAGRIFARSVAKKRTRTFPIRKSWFVWEQCFFLQLNCFVFHFLISRPFYLFFPVFLTSLPYLFPLHSLVRIVYHAYDDPQYLHWVVISPFSTFTALPSSLPSSLSHSF